MKEKRKIKALWLASWFPNRRDLLLGNFVEKQAQALANQCDIVVLFIADDNVRYYEIEIKELDFLEIKVYYPKTTNPILKLFRFLKAWQKGLECLKEKNFHPDIVHLNVLNPTGLVALYLKIFRKIPFVITEHWSGYNKRQPNIIRWHHRWLIQLCGHFSSKIIGISSYFVESMRLNGLKGEFEVISNIVDVDVFCKPIEKKQVGYVRLLHVSHLHDDHKNVSGILRGIQILSEKRQDFHLTIIGTIKRHELYLTLSKTLKINHLVTFKDSQTYQNIALEMQNSDVFVMFSNYEGLPVVLLEAMAVGLPVVVSETGGIQDWVSNDKGRVVEIGDLEGFVKALDDVLSQINFFLADKIRAEVVERCSNERVVFAIKNVYKEVLKIN
jgi:L-malate glycosyltransferase